MNADMPPPEAPQAVPEKPVGMDFPIPSLGMETQRREAELFSNVQYILEPHVPKDAPKSFKREFTRLEWLVSKNMALANIEREDIPHYMDYFSAIVLWLKFRRYDVAARRMIQLIMELQLTRSIRFGERFAQISTRQEIIATPQAGEKKSHAWWKIWR